MDERYGGLDEAVSAAKLLGYLNFSDGRPDPRWQKLLNDAYAYLAGRPLRLAPNGPPAGGLGLFMVRRLSFVHLPRYGFGALTGRFGPGAVSLADIDEFTVSGDDPVAYHVDGETLEPASKVHVRPASHALSVLV